MPTNALAPQALDQLFGNARTYSYFTDQPVDDATIYNLYEQLKFGPTSANSCPARFVFVRSAEAKEKLRPALDSGNVAKTMAAPVTVIVAHDLAFYEHLPTLFPHTNARSWYDGKPEKVTFDALRNGTLQGAYLIMAARALGLDCGPMGGFNQAMVNEAFFAGTKIQSNFLINLGYGDKTRLHPRNPRLDFATTCQIV